MKIAIKPSLPHPSGCINICDNATKNGKRINGNIALVDIIAQAKQPMSQKGKYV